jgi:hypothetical protein
VYKKVFHGREQQDLGSSSIQSREMEDTESANNNKVFFFATDRGVVEHSR